jgi:hypothetical protein
VSAVKTYGGVEVWLHPILTLALVAGECSASPLGHLFPGENALITPRTEDLVDVRAGLDIFETGKPFPSAVNQTMISHVSSTWPSHSNLQTLLSLLLWVL